MDSMSAYAERDGAKADAEVGEAEGIECGTAVLSLRYLARHRPVRHCINPARHGMPGEMMSTSKSKILKPFKMSSKNLSSGQLRLNELHG